MKMLQNCWEGACAFGHKIKSGVVVVAVAVIATIAGAAGTVAEKAPSLLGSVKSVLCRVAVWGLALFGFGHLAATSSWAEASAYIDQFEDAADQIVVDLGAALPIALSIAIFSLGIFIVWRVFKHLSHG